MSSVATDQPSPPLAGDGVNKRKQGSAACVHCHRRKVRCDARAVGLPCTNCRSSGKTDCRIHEKKKRLAVRSILDPVPIRSRPLPTSENNHSTTATPGFPGAFPGSNTATPLASGLPQHGFQSNAGSQPLMRQDLSHAHEAHTEMEQRLVKLIDEEDSGRREIQRGVRAFYVGHEHSNMSFLIRQQRDQDDDVFHFASNEIPRRQIKTGHDQLLMDALTLPETPLADELVQAYFTYVNPGFPVVDEDLFMTQYRNKDPTDPPPILLLQAILLVGTHVTKAKVERDALKEIFFRRTKYLFDNRIERNRDILVQTALLLTWHSDSADDDVAADAHFWVGVAARIATGLGMHRNPVSSSFVTRDRRMWRRVWYILVQFDVMVSLSHGRPQAINLDDSDVSPLTPADFENCGPHVQTDFVINFTELCTMISYVMRDRFGLRASDERRKAVLKEADESLANWSLKLPDNLRLRASDMDPWSAMLHLTYNNFLILLHRPHPRASAYNDDYGPHDAEICSAAAGVIASIFEELRMNDRLKYLWYTGVHTLFTAMIQVRVELRFSNPVLAINALRRFDSASYSLRELANYWVHAGTILRLFEDSKRLQDDLRLATREGPKPFNGSQPSNKMATTDAAAAMQTTQTPRPLSFGVPTPDSTPLQQTTLSPQPNPPQFDNWITAPLRLNVGPLDRSESYSNSAMQVDQIEPSRDLMDWRQLFSFTDSDLPVPMTVEGLPELEDEWRQIYWQDTPMADLIHDGGWMHN
ncbi:transcriptional regulator family: Fungal Specific TF [Penicillium lagena]|uniref:transcriptional regulator family: Fungal Specific TF n=1 Tax=Penicillium lagena TaxID=94218 RepID=UPI0025425B3A|nr:transcriptional regulator family: Fungal Specific TF [Penicillium lagena]KAJ5601294.1 transcriptional regulator family: Fungal Specific TF [Penicillium lagena]